MNGWNVGQDLGEESEKVDGNFGKWHFLLARRKQVARLW